MTPSDFIGAAANGTARPARHRDGQPVSIVETHGFTVHIDRHAGTVYEGVGADGHPFRVVQQVPYGFLPGVIGDDGEDYDVYAGPRQDAERVYVVTQCRAATGHYDEQKAMLGFESAEAAATCYGAHTAPAMLGRMGSLPLDAFRAQVQAWRANPTGPFRAETDEDAAELAALDEIEAAPVSEPVPEAA
jgi:hypothetical protein